MIKTLHHFMNPIIQYIHFSHSLEISFEPHSSLSKPQNSTSQLHHHQPRFSLSTHSTCNLHMTQPLHHSREQIQQQTKRREGEE